MPEISTPNANPRNRNPAGRNQTGLPAPMPEDYQKILQDMHDRKLSQVDMLEELQENHGYIICRKTLGRQIKTFKIATTRMNGMTKLEQTMAILDVKKDDPVGTYGAQGVLNKLAGRSIHIPRDFAANVLRTLEPEKTKQRHPKLKKIHRKGLYSIGPNEEWCADAHLKLFQVMGIFLYAFVDKCSRRFLAAWAFTRPLNSDLTLALYILVAQRVGGIPIRFTTDMGSETGKMANVQRVLRARYSELSEDVIPSHSFVKSVYNITVERAWKPLYHKELVNVLATYNSTKPNDFRAHDSLHVDLSRWIWLRVVRTILDEYTTTHNRHKIRLQRKINLPSGHSPDYIYSKPQKFGCEDVKITIPEDDLEVLVQTHVPEDLFQDFGAEFEGLAEHLYVQAGSPELTRHTAWATFVVMLSHYVV